MTDTKSYRQRRSGAAASDRPRSFGRRWARLLRHIPQGSLEIVAFGLLLIAGMTETARSGSGNIVPGSVVTIVGLTGLCWQSWKLRGRALEARDRREAFRMRATQRRLRRTRISREREERRMRVARDDSARKRARELQDAQRLAKVEMAAAEEGRRRAREEAISREATRLVALDRASFQEAATEAFELRGFRAVRPPDEANGDLLLTGRDGIRALARFAPHNRPANADDVRALEAWRRDEGAPTGFLIGINGFAPGAVRLSSAFPISLTDAHLLAQWRLAGLGDPAERRAN